MDQSLKEVVDKVNKKKNLNRGESHGGATHSMINQNQVRVKIRRSQTNKLSTKSPENNNQDTIGNMINGVEDDQKKQVDNNSSSQNITATEKVTHRRNPN